MFKTMFKRDRLNVDQKVCLNVQQKLLFKRLAN